MRSNHDEPDKNCLTRREILFFECYNRRICVLRQNLTLGVGSREQRQTSSKKKTRRHRPRQQIIKTLSGPAWGCDFLRKSLRKLEGPIFLLNEHDESDKNCLTRREILIFECSNRRIRILRQNSTLGVGSWDQRQTSSIKKPRRHHPPTTNYSNPSWFRLGLWFP